jgi:hypothetical protein
MFSCQNKKSRTNESELKRQVGRVVVGGLKVKGRHTHYPVPSNGK